MRDQLLGRAGEAIIKAITEHTDELEKGGQASWSEATRGKG